MQKHPSCLKWFYSILLMLYSVQHWRPTATCAAALKLPKQPKLCSWCNLLKPGRIVHPSGHFLAITFDFTTFFTQTFKNCTSFYIFSWISLLFEWYKRSYCQPLVEFKCNWPEFYLLHSVLITEIIFAGNTSVNVNIIHTKTAQLKKIASLSKMYIVMTTVHVRIKFT